MYLVHLLRLARALEAALFALVHFLCLARSRNSLNLSYAPLPLPVQ